MSEYTREEILKMIEEVGGPQNLDLSGKDLSGIDLSKEAITEELEKYRQNNPDQTPPWFSENTNGINLRGAILKEVNLLRAHLERAYLVEAHLEGGWLWEARLEAAALGRAHLEGADLTLAHLKRADLWRTHLERARLWWTDLEGAILWAHLEGADLLNAHLKRAQLWGAQLQGASLSGAYLEGANLIDAHLEGATFHQAQLHGAILAKAHLEKVDLSVAASLAGAYFFEAWLDQTRMTKEQLGGRIGEEIDKKYYAAKEAYLLLKNNFNQIGRYDDASWAYRKERRMERMTHRRDLAPKYYAYPELPWPLPLGVKGILHRLWLPFRKVGFHLGHLLHYLFDTAQLLLCDFGENPWLVLIWAAVVLFLFGLAYMGFGGLGPAPGVATGITLGDHFVYSLFAFATMGHPRIVATTGLAQFLTAFEALVGIFLAAIFVFTLGNRISRS